MRAAWLHIRSGCGDYVGQKREMENGDIFRISKRIFPNQSHRRWNFMKGNTISNSFRDIFEHCRYFGREGRFFVKWNLKKNSGNFCAYELVRARLCFGNGFCDLWRTIFMVFRYFGGADSCSLDYAANFNATGSWHFRQKIWNELCNLWIKLIFL